MIELLQQIASKLGTSAENLYLLIKFESGFNPFAKNPLSTARGLIQFTDFTAKRLGYKNSLDLVERNPTVESQLSLVYKYLYPYAPLNSLHKLAMAVFYPAYINESQYRPFPDSVRKVNPGISRPIDYVNKVFKKKSNVFVPLIILSGVAIYFLTRRKVTYGRIKKQSY